MDDQMNPEARRLLAEVRLSRTPSGDDKERVRKALAIGLAAAAASASATAAGATAAGATAAGATAAKAAGAAGAVGLSAGLKVAVSVAVVASLGGGAYWLTRPAPAPVRAMVTAPATPVVTTPPAAAPVVAAPAAPVPEPTVAVTAPVFEPPAAPAHPGRDPLMTELSLLHRAQQAWRAGNAARALSLAQEHAHRYPRSMLALERDALRVFALCALGQKAQARPLADDLLRRAPGSPLRTSVQESCGGR